MPCLSLAASITDFVWLPGKEARQDSKLGRFLDPLADKFLVVATLIAFLIPLLFYGW